LSPSPAFAANATPRRSPRIRRILDHPPRIARRELDIRHQGVLWQVRIDLAECPRRDLLVGTHTAEGHAIEGWRLHANDLQLVTRASAADIVVAAAAPTRNARASAAARKLMLRIQAMFVSSGKAASSDAAPPITKILARFVAERAKAFPGRVRNRSYPCVASLTAVDR
jgi:hypothetical protein